MSASGDGFQSANLAHQQDTLDAFSSLATSTASDRSTVADITVTNSTLAAGYTATHALLVRDFWDVTKLQARIADLKR